MVKSDRLLQLITHLQGEQNPVYAQRLLLKHIRQSSGAQLVAFFLLDQESQKLVLLAQNGRRPALINNPLHSSNLSRRPDIKHINLDGLFASVLHEQGLLYVPDPHTNNRILMEERYWIAARNYLMLSAIQVSNQPDRTQGVLALSFATQDDAQKQEQQVSTIEHDSEVRICAILLSAYLTRYKSLACDTAGNMRRPIMSSTVANLQPTVYTQQSTLPEMMYSLTSITELYEIGLIVAIDLESQDHLYQHILTHLCHVMRSPGACFLRYHAMQRCFTLAATQGEALAAGSLAMMIDGAAMERLALRGPGETLTVATIDGQSVLIVTLSCNCALLGIVVLALDEHTLLSERMLLLSYLGNIAALLLHNYDVQHARSKAALDRERNRIARDIHDGVAQRIVHVLHKLELIQRLLEKQQNQQARMEAQRAYTQIETSLRHLRQSISSLLPPELDAYPFARALQALLEEYRVNNPGVEIVGSISEEQCPAILETPIFRFIQGALNNVFQHAHATRVELRTYTVHEVLVIEVCDNGVGMHLEQIIYKSLKGRKRGASIGLRTMRERVQEAGGSWNIQSRPQEGTIVRAQFPVTAAPGLLTSRERDVLRLIVEGMTNRNIAEQLSISSDTVRSHIHHIIQKMRVKDRTQAAVLASLHGWL